ncbi:unnamed protein product, partial [Rotaria sp. Silwood2]
STDNQQQQNAMNSSGLIHLIATRGESNFTDNANDGSIVSIRTDDQTSEQLPLVPSSSAILPMDTEQHQLMDNKQLIFHITLSKLIVIC